jgi:hypothetical protein
MSDTKTYPLSAIMGNELTDKERIAELTDAFNRVCEENADFVAESIKDETRIAELAAQLKHCEGHAAELEAEVKEVRESGIALVGFLDEMLKAISIDKSCNARVRTIAATLEQQIKAVREAK